MDKNYISWDEYFMSLAVLSSYRSKDDSTKVGACIINSSNRIVSLGYNGMPNGCHDKDLPWGKDGEPYDTKYNYVIHAELNAILNSEYKNLQNCRIYTTLFPCCECAKAIIQSEIKEVIYLSDKYADLDQTKSSKRMFDLAGIKVRAFTSNKENININFIDN